MVINIATISYFYRSIWLLSEFFCMVINITNKSVFIQVNMAIFRVFLFGGQYYHQKFVYTGQYGYCQFFLYSDQYCHQKFVDIGQYDYFQGILVWWSILQSEVCLYVSIWLLSGYFCMVINIATISLFIQVNIAIVRIFLYGDQYFY